MGQQTAFSSALGTHLIDSGRNDLNLVVLIVYDYVVGFIPNIANFNEYYGPHRNDFLPLNVYLAESVSSITK